MTLFESAGSQASVSRDAERIAVPAGHPRSRRSTRQAGLDAIRGVAILLVVAYHYMGALPPGTPVNLLSRAMVRVSALGWSGVDLFFVLSGFLIGGILIDNRGSSTYFTTFYGRRFMRIVPLYALSLAAFAILFLYSDWQSRHLNGLMELGISPWSYVFFMQNFVIAGLGRWPGPGWLGVTWSLAVEEQFYLVLPALIRYLPKAKLPYLCIGAVVLAPIIRIALLAANPQNIIASHILFPCRMDSLFLGVLCAVIYRDKRAMDYLARRRRILIMSFIIGLIAILAGSHHLRIDTYFTQSVGFSLMGLFYSLGLIIALTARASPNWLIVGRLPLVWAGIGAYSIYLFHRPIQGLIEGYLGYATLGGRLTSFSMVLFAAIICWRLIERPSIAAARQALHYRTDASPVWSRDLLRRRLAMLLARTPRAVNPED
jgi:peptidoglycan/LPS O-acetylase OafA/YrhL